MRAKETVFDADPLSVMISSRCDDRINFLCKDAEPAFKARIKFKDGAETQSMEVLRRALKLRLEDIKIGARLVKGKLVGGKQAFKVWIHEDESAGSGATNTWDLCARRAKDADVFIMLYKGHSGWLGTDDQTVQNGIGICHAELIAAFDNAPVKVRGIQLNPLVNAQPGSPHRKFQEYVGDQGIPMAQVTTGDEALERADELAAAILLSLAREGVGVNSSGESSVGEALKWRRMNFHDRREKMTEVVVALLRDRKRGTVKQPEGDANVVAVSIAGSTIGFVCDSIPASMGTAAARELVGQPFLKDHEHTKKWDASIQGPVHLIACQKGVSETQALRQLGFPDAIVVSASFGVYVADDVQKIQMAFIANCRDKTNTEHNVQSFLKWLDNQKEAKDLAKRAKHRRQISDLIRGLR
jgi:hypothetical protein